MTAKELKTIGPTSMGDFMKSETERICPEYAADIMQMIDDEAPAVLSEKFRPELQAPCRLLVFTLVTKMLERLVEGVIDNAAETARAKVLKKTGTPDLKRVK